MEKKSELISLAAVFCILNRWTGYIAIRAENTTIIGFWFDECFTLRTLIKELAGISGHL
jgi:hypothetical protein